MNYNNDVEMHERLVTDRRVSPDCVIMFYDELQFLLYICRVEIRVAHLTGQFEGTGQSCSHFSPNGSQRSR